MPNGYKFIESSLPAKEEGSAQSPTIWAVHRLCDDELLHHLPAESVTFSFTEQLNPARGGLASSRW